MTAGILGWGAYVPRLRLPRARIVEHTAWLNPALRHQARGERAICNWDEDALTMAVEAARDCLQGERPPLTDFQLASTTLPFADRSNAGLAAAALDLDESVMTRDGGGSLRCATTALLASLRSSASEGLLVAAEHRLARAGSAGELRYGDAAAALHLGSGEAVVARFLGGASLARDLVDHYRASGERHDYPLEERWIRDEGYLKIVPEVCEQAFRDAGLAADAVDSLIFPGPARVGQALCRKLGIDPARLADDLAAGCGHAGSAQPLLMLAHVLEEACPGQVMLVLGFGQGADALLFRVTDAITRPRQNLGVAGHLALRREETEYLRYLSFTGQVDIEWGARAEHDKRTAQSVHFRKRRAITAFVGGRCSACGTAQFPRTRACVHCGAIDTQEEHRFADSTARVKSYTEDWQAHSPSPPLMYGSVGFAEGGSLMMEFTDFAPGELSVGTPLRMVFRIKDVDDKRGFTRYFWKPAPARNA
ncbi:MAG: OB-fold domain-containing protein [Gammaproteobacteria bacterium]|nr:OB-fold domain-containing protein [Gammaproteobacteria bacterium]TVQ48986.1 MAG: hydroxymethylglutaryl-CoA synthase family protein [Gammaproteobacteria bacterium]